MQIVNESAQRYSEKYTSPEDELVKEVADFTNQHHAHAQMLSGHLQGKFLEMISCMIRPKKNSGDWNVYRIQCTLFGKRIS